MRWTEEHPGAGNMNEIATFASRLRNRIDAIDRVGTTLHAARTEADSVVFAGAAGDAWRSSVDPLVTSLATLHQHLSTMETAAQTYRSGVAAIAASDADLNRRLASKRATRDALAMHGGSVVGVEQRIDALNDSIAALKVSLRALASQRKALDDAFCAALQPPAGLNNARYRAMVATYGASAFTGNLATFFTARDQKVAEYTELATKIASGDASQVEITKLTTFLTNSATDPALASAFWLNVGGDTTSALLAELALDTEPDNVDSLTVLAETTESIRTSLSVGSASWTQSQADEFAAGLFLNVPFSQYSLDAISYLFNDPKDAPMGAKLTVSVANELDLWEREPGRSPGGAVLLDKPAVTPLGQLMFLENEPLGDWDTAGNDPMARVFETLALYPDDALAWLSDTTPDPYWNPDNGGVAPTTGNARIEYWYGQREWEYDGWSGAGALWEGSMHADGAFASGTYDATTWDTACDVSSRVVAALDQSPSFQPDALSDAGGTNLGNAVAKLIPFAEYQNWTTVGQPRSDLQVLDPAQAYVPSYNQGRIPYLPRNLMNGVLITLIGDDAALVPLRQATLQTGDALLVWANDFADSDPANGHEAWDVAIERYTGLESHFAGLSGGADILQARLEDENIRLQMQVASLPLNFLPATGLGAAADFAVGQGAGLGVESLTDYLASSERMATELLDVTQEAGAAGLNAKLYALMSREDCNLRDYQPATMSTEEWFGTFLNDHEDAFYSVAWKEAHEME